MSASCNIPSAAGQDGAVGFEVVSRSDAGALLARARLLAAVGGRRILGITGAPGSGKSTLGAELVEALGGDAVLVPMDGFHLADDELIRLGRRQRKGAIDTFDAGGYLSLMRRLRAADEPVVYAPLFRREIEDAIAGSIPVAAEVPLVITEGNYLLAADPPWSEVASLLDEIWYVEPAEHVRRQRLVERHIAYGRDRAAAEAHEADSDQPNAELIATTRERADLVIVEP
jgi:pantothenate kinase